MENSSFSGQIARNTIIGSLLFISITFLIANTNSENQISKLDTIKSSNSCILVSLPDSIFEDSTTVTNEFEIGDTIDLTVAGMDSIFILYEDNPLAEGDTISDSTELELRLFDYTKDITITPGGVKKEIEQGLFGYHIEGMFTPKHNPQDLTNVNYPVVWNWLADIHPSVLRFPGGASSRWMHLLPYDTDGDNIDDMFPIGYGYDLAEIIRYYDITNETDDPDELTGNIQADDPVYLNDIIEDLTDNQVCNDCHEWMDIAYQTNLEDFAKKYFTQIIELPLLSQQQQYIDQFIALVDYIQNREGYSIEVIVELNVISESASQSRRIIEYLQNPAPKAEGGNGVTAVQIAGVEMGNEMGLDWGHDLMGYDVFDDYWYFINGRDQDDLGDGYFSPGFESWIEDYYTYVFNPVMQGDHNFISAFRSDPDFTVKTGIPAANLKAGPPDYFALRAEETLSTNWNEDLVLHYNDYITVAGENRYLFDAVILHPYYEPNGNFLQIPVDHYCDVPYPVTGVAPTCAPKDCDFWLSDQWQFSTEDERLKDPFEKMLGLSGNEFGNFKQFIRSRYEQSYNQLNFDLKFYLKNKPYQKELWTTEWNLKDRHNSYGSETFEQKRLTSYCNSFAHGLLIQEWFLNDLKINFDTDFRPGFHTYSTFHSWGGGAYYAMTLHADVADRTFHLDEFGNPDPLAPPPSGQDLWLKRTMYYTFEMLSEITKLDLHYVPANYSIYTHNPNIQPTMFINNTNLLYIYYSNMKNETQSYVVHPGNLIVLFPGAAAIGFGDAELFNVDPLRLYSGSGKSALFEMNTCYNNSDQLHPFEIQGISGPTLNNPECTGLPGGAICVTVPAQSFGYFTIPVFTSPREGIAVTDDQINIYPNPATTTIQLSCEIPESLLNEFVVNIFDLNGKLLINSTIGINDNIDVSSLPSGIYLVGITNKQRSFYIYKRLVKIE